MSHPAPSIHNREALGSVERFWTLVLAGVLGVLFVVILNLAGPLQLKSIEPNGKEVVSLDLSRILVDWKYYTDHEGRLWDCLEEANRRISREIQTRGKSVEGMGTTLLALIPRGRSARWISVGDSPLYLIRDNLSAIDVLFVMDATMSMDEELASVRSGMTSIVQVLRRLSDQVSVGFVAFTDRDVPWVVPLRSVTKGYPGDANLRRLLQEIGRVELVGNEDWPEDVCGGLLKATSLSWPAADEGRRQIIVIIGDARTHPEDHDRSIGIVRK